jgi:hypothetical protein
VFVCKDDITEECVFVCKADRTEGNVCLCVKLIGACVCIRCWSSAISFFYIQNQSSLHGGKWILFEHRISLSKL